MALLTMAQMKSNYESWKAETGRRGLVKVSKRGELSPASVEAYSLRLEQQKQHQINIPLEALAEMREWGMYLDGEELDSDIDYKAMIEGTGVQFLTGYEEGFVDRVKRMQGAEKISPRNSDLYYSAKVDYWESQYNMGRLTENQCQTLLEYGVDVREASHVGS